MILILMGVSGSGKTTIGHLLADDLGWPFYDGDSFHPPENVAKMSQRIPLTDADRQPWLAALRQFIDTHLAEGPPAVLSCSALKRGYRDALGIDRPGVRLVYLQGSFELIRGRLENRTDHFMPTDLLRSQFEALETPENALIVDVDAEPEAVAAEIRNRLDLR